MNPPDKNIRGIRDTIPPGFVLGRLGLSAGPARLVSLKELGNALGVSGTVVTPINPSGSSNRPFVFFMS
jgi:hypothetical protein